jgi:hypothetical protein
MVLLGLLDRRPVLASGFRLFAVRPDGPFAAKRRHGCLHQWLGDEHPEEALEVYGKLESASPLSLEVERNGQKLSPEYTVR